MLDKIIVKENSIAILGYHSGSAGQTETWIEDATGYHLACFVHNVDSNNWNGVDSETENSRRNSKKMDFPTRDSFKGRPLIASLNWIKHLKDLGINKVLPLTNGNRTRLKLIQDCISNNIELITAIHPTATIMPEVEIENGTWIGPRCHIGYKTQIHTGVMMVQGAMIGQHNIIERCAEVHTGAITTGNVTIGECATINAGATVIPRIEIGNDVIIGAGSVVLENVAPNHTAVGIPARVIKRIPPDK